MAQGKVVGQCYPRHAAQEFLKFLKQLDAGYFRRDGIAFGDGQLSRHKHPRVVRWLSKRPVQSPFYSDQLVR